MQLALISTDEPIATADFLAALGERVTVRTLPALSVSPASESEILAAALRTAESSLVGERPDAVLIDGDGPCALAAALVASKLDLPVGRLGAGRELATERTPGVAPGLAASYGRLVDRLATALFCETEAELAALERVGLGDQAVIASARREDSAAALATWLEEA